MQTTIIPWRIGIKKSYQMTPNSCLMQYCKDIYKIAIPRHWNPFRGFLKGKYKESKIWELGFFADGRQYRILGIFDPVRRKQAILLCGCYHKQKVYTPADALDTAYKRAKALADRKAKLHERKIKDNI